jgi:hypothetical protein
MSRYDLGFISDQIIFEHVKETVIKYRFHIDLREFNRNLIDPIKLTFDSLVYQRHIDTVIKDEILRQLDKSNNNHIGYFHQNIFKHIGIGWRCPDTGYDIVNTEEQIFVEMKNKHNTMNSSSSQKTYMRMLNTINKYPYAKCFLVEVIASNSQNVEWSISLDGEHISNERIRRVSIDKFYEIVTGDVFAFKKLCEILPLIIHDVVSSITQEQNYNSVISELKEIHPNIIHSLYLLSFDKYEGFQNFRMKEIS